MDGDWQEQRTADHNQTGNTDKGRLKREKRKECSLKPNVRTLLIKQQSNRKATTRG